MVTGGGGGEDAEPQGDVSPAEALASSAWTLGSGSPHPWCVPGLVSRHGTRKMGIAGPRSLPSPGTLAQCSTHQMGQGQMGVAPGHSWQAGRLREGAPLVASPLSQPEPSFHRASVSGWLLTIPGGFGATDLRIGRLREGETCLGSHPHLHVCLLLSQARGLGLLTLPLCAPQSPQAKYRGRAPKSRPALEVTRAHVLRRVPVWVCECVRVCAQTHLSLGASCTFPCGSSRSCPGRMPSHFPPRPKDSEWDPCLGDGEGVRTHWSIYSLAKGGEGQESPLGIRSQAAGLLVAGGGGLTSIASAPRGLGEQAALSTRSGGSEQVVEEVGRLRGLFCGAGTVLV